jgi:hypothetical protein
MFVIYFLIFVSTCIYILETVPGWEWEGWKILETVVSIVFTIEFAVRICCCRSLTKYARDPLNIIDFCAVFPYWIELMSSGSLKPEQLRLIRIVRLLLLVRLTRSRSLAVTITVFTNTVKVVFHWILMFIFFSILSITIFASFEYFFEVGLTTLTGVCDTFSNQTICSEAEVIDRVFLNQTSRADCGSSCEKLRLGGCCSFNQTTGDCVFHNDTSQWLNAAPEQFHRWSGLCRVVVQRIPKGEKVPSLFKEIPSAIWWAAATVNMVGYGEIYPVTISGRILGAFLCMLGVLCMAFPLIVVGSSFKAAIIRVQYRLNILTDTKVRLGSPMALLQDMNAIAGLEIFNPEDELVFLADRLSSRKKIQQILSKERGWNVLPFAPDKIVDRPKLTQFKLYVLYELYGRKFRRVTKARRKYRWVLKSKLRSAIKRENRKRKKWNVPKMKFGYNDDIPLTVKYECHTAVLVENLLPTPEDDVSFLPDITQKLSKTIMMSEAKDPSNPDEGKASTPKILKVTPPGGLVTSLVESSRQIQSLNLDGTGCVRPEFGALPGKTTSSQSHSKLVTTESTSRDDSPSLVEQDRSKRFLESNDDLYSPSVIVQNRSRQSLENDQAF